MKKGTKIIGYVLSILLLLVLGGIVALQSPLVQTYLGRRVIRSLEKSVDAEVRFSDLTVVPFEALVLKDLAIIDRTPSPCSPTDTVASVDYLTARFSLMGLLRGQGVYVTRMLLDGGSFCLVTEENGLLNIDRILGVRSDGNDRDFDFGHIVDASTLEINNFRYRMTDAMELGEMEELPPGVINWLDLDARLSAKIRNLSVAFGYVKADVLDMTLSEKSGFSAHSIRGKVKVGGERTDIDNLHIADKSSNLDLRRLSLIGPLRDYSDFVDRITIDGQLRSSVLSMQTIKYFAPGLDGMTFTAEVKGRIRGTVNDIRVEAASFKDLGCGVEGEVSGSLRGVTDIETAVLDYNVERFSFTVPALAEFISEWVPGAGPDLSSLPYREQFTFSGNILGTLQSLGVSGTVTSPSAGGLTANVRLENLLERTSPIEIGALVAMDNLGVGKITGRREIGDVSLRTRVRAAIGDNGASVEIDTLRITKFQALGYSYSRISASGSISGDGVDLSLRSDDPHLALSLAAKSETVPGGGKVYSLDGDLGKADLDTLGFDSRGRSAAAMKIGGRLSALSPDNYSGFLSIRDILLENDSGKHPAGDVLLSAEGSPGKHSAKVESGLANISYKGSNPLPSAIRAIEALVLSKELTALREKTDTTWERGRYSLEAKFGDTRELLAFLSPGLYIDPDTGLSLSITPEGRVDALLNSHRIAMESKYVRDISLKAGCGGGDHLTARMDAEAVNAGLLEFKGNSMTLNAEDNRITMAAGLDESGESDGCVKLNLEALLSRTAEGLSAEGRFLPSGIELGDGRWDITSDLLSYTPERISIRNFTVRSDDNLMSINGGLSPGKTDTLSLDLRNFDIAVANRFIPLDIPLEGLASGSATVISPSAATPGILADIRIDSTNISGLSAGTVKLSSKWNPDKERFDLSAINDMGGGRHSLDLSGKLYPGSSRLEASVSLDSLELGYLSPVLETVFSDFGGHLSGHVDVDGEISAPRISSRDLELEDGRFKVAYTGVAYSANGPVTLTEQALTFNDVALSDGESGTGTVSGSIGFGGFKDLSMDTHLRFREMKVLSLAQGENPVLYGTAYGNGRLGITGPFTQLTLSLDASTTRNGDLHLPIGNSKARQGGDLLTFTQPVTGEDMDPYEQMLRQRKAQSEGESDLNVLLRVGATPDVTTHLDLAGGTRISGWGNGDISIETRTSDGSFSLGGAYLLNGGECHLNALGLASRDFKIKDGSSVRFAGDVMDTELDITGIYSTRASLANLLSDSTAVGNRAVNCEIHITDKLTAPEISFGIDIPDLDPGTQGIIQSALNTEDKVQKQFVYLLLTNSFLPIEESGINSGSSGGLLYNVASIMSGQLSNILRQLDIPVDLGINYQSSSRGNDIFDVALSTQLFNNRVLVNGSIGNKRYGSATTGEVIGDLDIEIKIDKPGNVRLNLFSHSADQYTNILDNSQRNGVGVAYQKSFNTWTRLIRDIFTSHRAKEERRLREGAAQEPGVVLRIDSNGKSSQEKVNRANGREQQ